MTAIDAFVFDFRPHFENRLNNNINIAKRERERERDKAMSVTVIGNFYILLCVTGIRCY